MGTFQLPAARCRVGFRRPEIEVCCEKESGVVVLGKERLEGKEVVVEEERACGEGRRRRMRARGERRRDMGHVATCPMAAGAWSAQGSQKQ
eukprot:1776826-Rhodomonas_salina.2